MVKIRVQNNVHGDFVAAMAKSMAMKFVMMAKPITISSMTVVRPIVQRGLAVVMVSEMATKNAMILWVIPVLTTDVNPIVRALATVVMNSSILKKNAMMVPMPTKATTAAAMPIVL